MHGKLNVYVRSRNCCKLEPCGYPPTRIFVRDCCGNLVATADIPAGQAHAEIEVPPGCYVVDGDDSARCCPMLETIAVVGCGQTVCVNLIKGYHGLAWRFRLAFHKRAREIKIPEEEIVKVRELIQRTVEPIPLEEREYISEEEFEERMKITADEYEDILRDTKPLIVG